MKRLTVLLFCSISLLHAAAQSWDSLEAAINRWDHLRDRLKQVNQLLEESRAAMVRGADESGGAMTGRADESRAVADFARGLNDRMKIMDRLTEDTFFFRNSRFIDSILESPAPLALKTAMRIMKARRLGEFISWYRYRPRGYLIDKRYGSMSPMELDSLIKEQLDRGLAEGAPILRDSAGAFAWLLEPGNDVAFAPVWGDILYAARGAYAPDQKKDYKAWMVFHAGEEDIHIYLEAVARRSESRDSAQEESYISYLQGLATSAYPLVSAYATVQLCWIWKERGDRYAAVSRYNVSAFRPAYRFYYLKAMQLYTAHAGEVDRYPVFRLRMDLMRRLLGISSVRLRIEPIQIPGKPILAHVLYRNVDTLHVRIRKKGGGYARMEAIPLAGVKDYQYHGVFLKLDSLPPGKYTLTYGMEGANKRVSLTVTRIGTAFDGDRLYVLDRVTGLPLAGARVSGKRGSGMVNGEGFVPWSGRDTVNIRFGGDTLAGVSLSTNRGMFADEVYEGDTDDDLLSYYKENTTMNIFTDRGIYRPGQKVFFKGIFVIRNPLTGAAMALTSKDISERYFRKLTREKIGLTLQDPFQKIIDSLKVSINDYGSVSGSFQLPATAATGDWEFNTDEKSTVEVSTQGGRFRVEEYKRPTYELTLEKPTQPVRLLDTFSIRVRAASYAGAPLQGVRLQYKVTAVVKDTISLGTAETDSSGCFLIPVKDMTSRGSNTYYQVSVSGTDPSGESHEAQLEFDLTDRPITLTTSLGAVVDAAHPPKVSVWASDPFAGAVKRPVILRFYRIEADTLASGKDHEWEDPTDTGLYAAGQLEAWFPWALFSGNQKSAQSLVYEVNDTAGGDRPIEFPAGALEGGAYRLEVTCREGEKVVGERDFNFSVFNKRDQTFPISKQGFEYLSKDSLGRGKPFFWTIGQAGTPDYSVYSLSWIQKGRKGLEVRRTYQEVAGEKGLTDIRFLLPGETFQNALVTRTFFRNNATYTQQSYLYVPAEEGSLSIEVDRYRKVLAPGAPATFEVSVKTGDVQTAAELMTTLYDASLDALQKNDWEIPNRYAYVNLYNTWAFTPNEAYLGWLNEPETAADSVEFLMEGKVEGVVVSAVGFKQNRLMSAPAMTQLRIRGIGSGLEKMPLTIVDGKEFNGNINMADYTDALVLKGADAEALYGARAANGVLVLSTHGPVQLPVGAPREAPPLVVRRDFSETAFFYPSLYADRDGRFRIQFTLPESVTSWRWMMMAHTLSGSFAYLERSLVSQLPLMVQPAVPRFLYQGDRVVLSSRITNMDSSAQAGTLRCLVTDEVTGETLKDSALPYAAAPHGTFTGAFVVGVPSGLLHPLRIRVTVRSSDFSDGEEHVVPVLSPRILASSQVPLRLSGGASLAVTAPVLPPDATPFGVGLFIDPQPQASVLDALPFLANDPYGCAEQTFNKILAFTLARKIGWDLRPGPGGDTAKGSGDYFEMPDADLMPWLTLNHAGREHQRELRRLMDTVYDASQIAKYSDLLKGMQNADGGMTWFKGGKSDPYISFYMLGSLGSWNMRIVDVDALITYCDSVALSSRAAPYYADARTYWLSLKALPRADSLLLGRLLSKSGDLSLGPRAALIAAVLRYGKEPFVGVAQDRLESIRQEAIMDSAAGTRWKDISDQDDLTTGDEEALVKLADAFGVDSPITDGILQWLLGTRSDHHWSSTKSTADVLSLLYRRKPAAMVNRPGILSAGGMRVTNDLTRGEAFAFDSVAPHRVDASGAGAVQGGLTYYYFTSHPVVSGDVVLTRVLERFDAGKWAPASEFHVGDRVRATLTIETPRRLSYVVIEDRRAANLEPVDALSGYRYSGDFGYYCSVRDASIQCFADEIPAGRSTFSYEMRVNAAGTFTYGAASLECMYRPEVKAYSATDPDFRAW